MKLQRSFLLFLGLCILFLSTGCHTKRKVDLIVYNGTIYTVNNAFSITSAMAVRNGKIVSIGNSDEILDDYEAVDMIDLKGKFVYPGFIDAHCHFFGYATDLLKCDLTGTKSVEEILETMVAFSKSNQFSWLLARGWDQNDWENKNYPTKEILDSLFPDKPVYALRIDGHAALCNQVALDLAGITTSTQIQGGEILQENGKLTGLLIDNAVDLVKSRIPEFGKDLVEEALLMAQKKCFEVGLTTVDDAGLGKDSIAIIDKLQKEDKLKIRVYAMFSDDLVTRNHYFNAGPFVSDRLTVRSVKIYSDGALGSRGACMKEAYSDQAHHHGFLLRDPAFMESIAAEAKAKGFQVCTHAIGDSAVETVMRVYENYVSGENNRRWRIEHCQVVSPRTMKLFGNNSIIPSVQPTHATSDMYWAEDRIGPDRIKYAYAYNDLLQNAEGVIALGTDFPVEDINPLNTFYAAVHRADKNDFPDQGFQRENALSKKDALRGMTLWAAYSNFEEEVKGSLEDGKFADFVVLEKDIMEISEKKIPKVEVLYTFLNGEMVFQK
ncbi:MAG: amidohydrolase [Bacteroidia bacterium]|nr:amidohydrolase [Bacteroidia bacterium]